MSDGKGQAVGGREPKLKVQLLIELGERTPAWRRLMERLLSPPSCKGDGLLVDYRQEGRKNA